MTLKLKPLFLHVPFTRSDATSRIVEGYTFVNERVPGDVYALKRSAMLDATPGYQEWGAVREMHQPSAVGTALGEVTIIRADGVADEVVVLGVQWDDKGAFVRCKVVDDNAWKKVEAGVYKAFSVGVIPTQVRGKDIVGCRWAEISLVDRPKDTDCPIGILRFDGDTPGADLDVPEDLTEERRMEIAAEIQRGKGAKTFNDFLAAREGQTLRSLAVDSLSSALYNTLMWDDVPAEERGAVVDKTLKEFRSYLQGCIDRAEIPFEQMRVAELVTLTRAADGVWSPGVITDDSVLVRSADLRAIIGETATQRAEITRLAAIPRVKSPVRFLDGIDPAVMKRYLDEDTPASTKVSGLQEELTRLEQNPGATAQEREISVRRMQSIKAELQSLGI